MPESVHEVSTLGAGGKCASGTLPFSPRGFAFALTLIMATAASLLLFFFEPGHYSFYPRCLFHQTTGLLCPGCGSLRAMHQLLHGHLVAAFHLNALLVLSIPPVCWVAGRSFLCRLKGQSQIPGFHPAWLWAALALGVSFGILRNLPFAHALWLAP
jgi:hypothetical protein